MNYLLLPKLNSAQMLTVANRLTKIGFHVGRNGSIVARSKVGTIHVDPAGLCWSNMEIDGPILPVLPEIIAAEKEEVSLKSLEDAYFRVPNSSGNMAVRIATRVEATSNWDALRSVGESGLTPDERLVSSFFIGVAGNCQMLTDYPADDSVPVTCGKKRYYETELDGREASDLLRAVGERRQRNSYLLRNSTIESARSIKPSQDDVAELLNGLGEWCFLVTA